ncbi:unspecific monooxygenase [Ostertagia ostertagi]
MRETRRGRVCPGQLLGTGAQPADFKRLMLVLLGVGCILIYLCIEWMRRVRRYPPGPFPLPLIGNLHHIIIGNIKYGGIVELMKKWQKTAKEEMIVNGAAYADRYTPYALDVKRVRLVEGRGTVFSSGDFWADHRRFTLRTLRDFALKNSIMEERIMDEFSTSYFAKLEETMVDGETKINAGEFFDVLIGSVINRIIFSEVTKSHNLKDEDYMAPSRIQTSNIMWSQILLLLTPPLSPRAIRFEDIFKRYFQESTAEFFEVKHLVDKEIMGLTAFGMSLEKWTLNLPILKYKWRKLIEPQEKLVEFLQKRLDQRKEDIASGRHSLHGDGDDFVDAFSDKDGKRSKRRSTSYASIQVEKTSYCTMFLTCGLLVTKQRRITVMWGFMHLIKNPTIIEKIRAELNVVTNGNRSVSLSDKEHTPYLNWTVLETQRLASIVSLNLWRKTKEGRKVGGYFVPEGTAIAAELSLIMSEEKYFKDPLKFDPGRYEEGGKELEQRVIPFGIGKRSCIGETLAKAEIYLVDSGQHDLSL